MHAQSAKLAYVCEHVRKLRYKKDMNDRGEIVIYQTQDGLAKLDVILEGETVWITQDQMAELFDRDRTAIGRHISSIFSEGELDRNMVCANFAHTTSHGALEGKTQTRMLTYYNLDVIISVGYRVKSKREYPIVNTLRSQLNWSQYRSLIQILNPNTPRYDSI